MTTVVYRDGVMACDSQSTGSYHERVRKIVRLSDGTMVGACGRTQRCQAVMDWLVADCDGKCPPMSGVGLLIAKPDGSIWCADDDFRPYRLRQKFAAIGSGSAVAIGAMEAGASALQAVKIAAKHDGGTSAPFKTLQLK